MTPEAFYSPTEHHNLGVLMEQLLSSPDPSYHLGQVRSIRSGAECYSGLASDDLAWNQSIVFLEQGESEEFLRTSLVVHAAGAVASADALLEAAKGRQRFYLAARREDEFIARHEQVKLMLNRRADLCIVTGQLWQVVRSRIVSYPAQLPGTTGK